MPPACPPVTHCEDRHRVSLGLPSVWVPVLPPATFAFHARCQPLCQLGRQLSHLRIGGDLHGYRLLRRKVFNRQSRLRGIDLGDQSSDVPKAPEDHLLGLQVRALIAPAASGAELVSYLNLVELRSGCVLPFHGLGRIPPVDRLRSGADQQNLAPSVASSGCLCPCCLCPGSRCPGSRCPGNPGHRKGHRSRLRVYLLHQSAHPATLPIQHLLLCAAGDVLLL